MFRNPPRLVAAITFAGLWAATATNALWLQTGQHPAPLVQNLPWQAAPAPGEAAAPARPTPDPALVRDIQTALAQHGFYNGEIDGLYGAGTRAALESYQRMAGEEVGTGPTPAVLARIQLSTLEAPPLPPGDPRGQQASLETAPEAPAAPAQEAAGAADTVPESDPKVAAVQRVLADLGYAPGPIDGRWGNATSGAIRRFEQDRGMEVTGELGERVLRELSDVSGVQLR